MACRLILLFFLLTAGCANVESVRQISTRQSAPEMPAATYSRGSLWQSDTDSPFRDVKASRPGDIITVIISESASASKEANTATSRKAEAGASMPNLLGLESKLSSAGWLDLGNLLKASYDSSFNGGGSTSRKENLRATMACRVVESWGNGTLRIEGQRNVTVNGEEQIIVLEGLVRMRDISPENTVTSALLADARIHYTGRGDISDRTRRGWLSRGLEMVWPF